MSDGVAGSVAGSVAASLLGHGIGGGDGIDRFEMALGVIVVRGSISMGCTADMGGDARAVDSGLTVGFWIVVVSETRCLPSEGSTSIGVFAEEDGAGGFDVSDARAAGGSVWEGCPSVGRVVIVLGISTATCVESVIGTTGTAVTP